ncbi:MAG: MarR family winged helix-turn-helix transcriptional regulator [Fimbriimonadaceae bacterium]
MKATSGWELVRQMWLVQYAIFCRASHDLEAWGLNPKSLAVLGIAQVTPHPHDITQSLGTPFPTVSNILKELERRGYVERRLAPGDRRRTIVTVTPEGLAAHDQAVAAVNRRSAEILNQLSDLERATLAQMLARLSANAPVSLNPESGHPDATSLAPEP